MRGCPHPNPPPAKPGEGWLPPSLRDRLALTLDPSPRGRGKYTPSPSCAGGRLGWGQSSAHDVAEGPDGGHRAASMSLDKYFLGDSTA